jgi:hypothetical protein
VRIEEDDAMDLTFGIYTMGGKLDNLFQVDGVDSFLVSIATLHPHYSHMHHFHGKFLNYNFKLKK